MATKKTTESELSFEKAISRLNDIAEKLESGKATLEESLTLYEEGSRLIKSCTKQLDSAEKKIKLLDNKAEDRDGANDE
jgi:exodeoxyribonuclease VII small subunit